MVALVWRDGLGDGIVGVDLLQRRVAADGYGLDLGVALVVVDVETAATGSHDDVVTHVGRLDAALLSLPAHDGGRGG